MSAGAGHGKDLFASRVASDVMRAPPQVEVRRSAARLRYQFVNYSVAVARALGMAQVVATGRNQAVLDDLASQFGPRFRAAALIGQTDDDTRNMQAVADGPIDCVLDILPPNAEPGVACAAIMSVRLHARAVLISGIGMLGVADLGLPYPGIMRNCITLHGQWMHPQSAAPRLIELARSGLPDLWQWQLDSFTLDAANEAIAHGAAQGGPFRTTIVVP